MQSAAVNWGFQPDDVGLVTGNRRENPDARVLVVVAEILLTACCTRPRLRLSRRSAVSAVVMDEFHSFTDPERGIVWELSLGLLPRARPHAAACRPRWATPSSSSTGCGTATTGELELVEGDERKVPLSYHWVGDMLLTEQLEEMAQGDDASPHDARPGLLLQPRRMLDRGRAAQGQAGPQRRPAEAARRPNWSSTTGRKGPGRS